MPLISRIVLLAVAFSVFHPLVAQRLHPYKCISAHTDPAKWLLQFERGLDSNGVVIQKKEYHPLSIAFFGIMCYDEYKRTGDKKFLSHCENQYRYFKDTTHLDFIQGGEGAGLPYNYNYKEMKAPWYSGMTQGVGISFLLRYYTLTKDRTALLRAKQLALFMLRPVETGGTIGKTPEGGMWIEEYPRSKNSPEVLNGFINGLVGLKEYCDFFPKDTAAQRVHDSCYASMIRSFRKYDTYEWTQYDRARKPVTNQYMRYQIGQLDHLYEIYGDDLLLRQMMIWSMFAYGKKDNVIRFYRSPNYQFAVMMEKKDSAYVGPAYFTTIKTAEPKARFSGLQGRLPFRLKGQRRYKLNTGEARQYVQLEFDRPIESEELSVELLDRNGGKVAFEMQIFSNFVCLSADTAFEKIGLRRLSPSGTGPEVRSVAYPDPVTDERPFFLFLRYTHEDLLTINQKYRLELKTRHTTGMRIFYRYHVNKNSVAKSLWETRQVMPGENPVFTAPQNGYYEFFFCIPLQVPGSKISDIRLTPVDP